MAYFYISFAMSKAEGGFRGATVVQANSAGNALTVATMRGLNPGGEAAILALSPKSVNNPDMRAMLNRLLNREQMMAQGAVRHDDLPQKIRERFDAEAETVCSDCNPASRRHAR